MGNAWLNAKDQTTDVGRRSAPNKSGNNEQRSKRGYDNKENNDKLEFLNNPIKRPAALADKGDEKQTSEDIPPQSMATASRLANLEEKDNQFVDDLPEFAENENENENDVSHEHKSIGIIDPDEEDQGQSHSNYDDEEKSNQNVSIDIHRESLTFKADGYLKTNQNPNMPSASPMSFGGALLKKNTIAEHENE